jgi:hypothetical protein
MSYLRGRQTYEQFSPSGFNSDDVPLQHLIEPAVDVHETQDVTVSFSAARADSFRAESRVIKPSWIGKVVSNWWAWELVSWVCSACCLTAIAVVLVMHNDAPLPRWPLHITINAFVSFFSTLIRVSMSLPLAEAISQLKWIWFERGRELHDFQSFDSASRGPLGSFQLLGRTRW